MENVRASIQPATNVDPKPVAQSRQGGRTVQEILPFKEESLIISDFSSNFVEFQFEEIRLRDYMQASGGFKLSDTMLNCTFDMATLPQGDANNTVRLMSMLEATNVWDTDTFYENYFTVTPTLRNLAATERPAEVTAPTVSFRHQIDPHEQHELSNNTKRMIYNTYLRSRNQYTNGNVSQLNTSGLDVDRPINTTAHFDLNASTIEPKSTLTEEIIKCEHMLTQHISQNLLNKGMEPHQRLEAAGIDRAQHGSARRLQRQSLQGSRGTPNVSGSLNVSAMLQGSSRPSTAAADTSTISSKEEKLSESWRSALQPGLGIL